MYMFVLLLTQQPIKPTITAFRANPFPEVTDLFCRFPLSTFFYLTRGFSPWRPDAVMSTAMCECDVVDVVVGVWIANE